MIDSESESLGGFVVGQTGYTDFGVCRFSQNKHFKKTPNTRKVYQEILSHTYFIAYGLQGPNCRKVQLPCEMEKH